MMGTSLLMTGDIAEGRVHYDRALALFEPAEHCPLGTRFGQDLGTVLLCYRPLVMWLLGYPEAALTGVDRALKDARVRRS
jgi:hypothetical protein